MAKLQEEVIVVKVSKLLKDTDAESVILDNDTVVSIEAVVQELAGAGTLVEVQKA
jgi:hypothetical protein